MWRSGEHEIQKVCFCGIVNNVDTRIN
jgi:hypothetical protein